MSIDPLKKLPYNAVLKTVDWIRKHLFTNDWPDVDSAIIHESEEDFRERLRNMHFEGVHLSYRYKGQDVDLRRPEFVDEDGYQFELHVKARRIVSLGHEGRPLEVIMHVEYSRYEHQEEHINTKYLRWLTPSEMYDVIFEGKTAEK